MESVAAVVNLHHPSIAMEVIETGGSLDNSRLLDAGYADLAVFQADANGSKRARLLTTLAALRAVGSIETSELDPDSQRRASTSLDERVREVAEHHRYNDDFF